MEVVAPLLVNGWDMFEEFLRLFMVADILRKW